MPVLFRGALQLLGESVEQVYPQGVTSDFCFSGFSNF